MISSSSTIETGGEQASSSSKKAGSKQLRAQPSSSSDPLRVILEVKHREKSMFGLRNSSSSESPGVFSRGVQGVCPPHSPSASDP